MRICSFNVQNFKLETRPDTEEFKKHKIEKIARLIQKSGGDIIALQEIQDENTVQRLAALLGYGYCHCQDLYEALNRKFENKNRSDFKAEYAFLWCPERIVLDTSPAIYQGISEQLSRALDLFIAGTAALLCGLIYKSRKKNAQKRTDDATSKDNETAILGALGLSAIGVGHCVKESVLKEIIGDTLRQTLRPPLIGVFRKVRSNENKEIRLINIHTQFRANPQIQHESSTIVRSWELQFILGRLFDIVASQRDGGVRTPITIVAGDYNFTLQKVQVLSQEPDCRKYHSWRRLKSVQDNPSTIRIENPEQVAQGQEAEYSYVNDYDHFTFDQLAFPEFGQPVTQRIVWSKEEFFVGEVPISDHSPVQIEFLF